MVEDILTDRDGGRLATAYLAIPRRRLRKSLADLACALAEITAADDALIKIADRSPRAPHDAQS